MNRFLYSFIIWLGIPFALLKILLKDSHDPSWKVKLKNQLGFVPKISDRVIWIHSVSLGEFNASKPLVDNLLDQYPKYKILLTTTTITGSVAVKNHYKNKIIHCFFPFDSKLIIKSFLRKIQPEICILMETEIWPNLIHTLNKKNIPVCLINARLSEKSFNKYQKFSPKLVSETLRKLTLICSQNAFSSTRFIKLGANEESLINTGSLKFDSDDSIDVDLANSLRQMVGDRHVIVFASTRDGEERLIIESYIKHKGQMNCLLVIIPRHPERFDETAKIAEGFDLNVNRRSEAENCSEDTDILVGDSMGEMMAYYSISDIAFIGGSLTDNGCQNMLEAASLSKPIIFGPSVYNFEEISKQLLDNNASIQVSNADELMQTISQLLSSKSRRDELGANARKTFENNQGAANNILSALKPYIKN
ncbi:3-deoxy-D-manno-octulosonic acid transferase [Candidatus Thioglobus sp.]|nr:3-deoxy-D-manno-octulosonic acid transferase [Candidatus Thioglobus sp.]